MRGDQITRTMNLSGLFYAGNFQERSFVQWICKRHRWQIVIVLSWAPLKAFGHRSINSLFPFSRCIRKSLLKFKDAINFDAIKGQGQTAATVVDRKKIPKHFNTNSCARNRRKWKFSGNLLEAFKWAPLQVIYMSREFLLNFHVVCSRRSINETF